jgi:hypothetical protein
MRDLTQLAGLLHTERPLLVRDVSSIKCRELGFRVSVDAGTAALVSDDPP